MEDINNYFYSFFNGKESQAGIFYLLNFADLLDL